MNCYRCSTTDREVWFVVARDIGEATALASAKCLELGDEPRKLRIQEFCGTDLASLIANGAFTGLNVGTKVRVIVQAMADHLTTLKRSTEYLEILTEIELIQHGMK